MARTQSKVLSAAEQKAKKADDKAALTAAKTALKDATNAKKEHDKATAAKSKELDKSCRRCPKGTRQAGPEVIGTLINPL